MRRMLFALLMICGLVLTPVSAGADEAFDVSGDWTYVPTSIEIIERDGPNVFILGTDIGTWTGSFIGTTTEEFVVVHVPARGINFYYGELVFEGTVVDDNGTVRSGTMMLRTSGKQDPGTVEPGPGIWVGSWTIVDASGGLAGIQGHGAFTGPSLDVDYWGTVSF